MLLEKKGWLSTSTKIKRFADDKFTGGDCGAGGGRGGLSLSPPPTGWTWPASSSPSSSLSDSACLPLAPSGVLALTALEGEGGNESGNARAICGEVLAGAILAGDLLLVLETVQAPPPPPLPLLLPFPLPPSLSLTFSDVFSGIGGFTFALSSLGCSRVLSCELSLPARLSHDLNHPLPSTAPFPNDITRLPSSLLLSPSPATKIPGPPHIFTGGFPCQSFSSHGTLEGFSDPRTGGLFAHVLRLLSSSRPPVVLLENVKGLLTHDGGKTVATVRASLEGLGYTVKIQVVDASSILPQTRNRAIIVCFIDPAAAGRFTFPSLPSLGRSLASELEPPGSPHFVHLSSHQWSKINSSSYHQAHPTARVADTSLPAATLQSSYKSGFHLYSQFVPVPSKTPRFLTPRECCRLQGFPESFLLPTTVPDKNAFYKLIGNAVPVPVIVAIGVQILRALGRRCGDGEVLEALKRASRDPEEVERVWREKGGMGEGGGGGGEEGRVRGGEE